METEKKAVDTLLDSPRQFKVEKRSILRFIGKKERIFFIRQSTLGTLYHISRLSINLNFDESKIQKDPFFESKVLIEQHIKAISLIVAISVLNSRWKIYFLKNLLALYFRWRLTPSTLFALLVQIDEYNNVKDFMNSIRLARGWRITMPNLSPEVSGG